MSHFFVSTVIPNIREEDHFIQVKPVSWVLSKPVLKDHTLTFPLTLINTKQVEMFLFLFTSVTLVCVDVQPILNTSLMVSRENFAATAQLLCMLE